MWPNVIVTALVTIIAGFITLVADNRPVPEVPRVEPVRRPSYVEDYQGGYPK